MMYMYNIYVRNICDMVLSWDLPWSEKQSNPIVRSYYNLQSYVSPLIYFESLNRLCLCEGIIRVMWFCILIWWSHVDRWQAMQMKIRWYLLPRCMLTKQSCWSRPWICSFTLSGILHFATSVQPCRYTVCARGTYMYNNVDSLHKSCC